MIKLVTRRASGLWLLHAVFFCHLSYGQSTGNFTGAAPKVVPPSPNAAALGKYGDIPVSAYTGVPDISIPLYQITSRDISVPVSLSYHASGIRVTEESSRVGLGWVLNAGGLISRTVMGEDDFAVSPYAYHSHDAPELPYGFATRPAINGNPVNAQPSCSIEFQNSSFLLDKKYTQDVTPLYDFQPDQYSYNFAGSSGKFILDRQKRAFLGKQEKILIRPKDAAASAWEVKTANGFTYTFADHESYKVNDQGAEAKSSWYLSSIKSPAGEEVTFHYSTVENYSVKTIGSYSERIYEANLASPPPLSGCAPSPPPATEEGTVPGRTFTSVILDYIDFRGGRVVFGYESRLDTEGDRRLTSVKVYRKQPGGTLESTPFKEFALAHDYFVSDPVNTPNNYVVAVSDMNWVTHRLKLVSVTEKGTVDGQTVVKNPHVFTYYEPLQLPKKTSFARDHWGYYNGRTNNTSLVPAYTSFAGGTTADDIVNGYIGIPQDQRDANPTEGVATAFSLQQIQYPTGGRTQFDYEVHDYDLKKSKERDNSYFGQRQPFVREQEIDRDYFAPQGRTEEVAVEAGELDLRNVYVRSDGTLTSTTLEAHFQYSNYSTGCNDGNNYNTDGVRFEIVGANGAIVASVQASSATCTGNIYEYFNSYFIPPGLYKWKVYIKAVANDMLTAEFRSMGIKCAFQERIDPNVNPVILYGGGLRVKRIIDYDEKGTEAGRKRFVYRQTVTDPDGTLTEKSYGRLMATPQYTYIENRTSMSQSSNPDGGESHCEAAVLVVRASDSNIPLNGSAGGSVVGYDQVTMLYGENGENGKTVFEYDNQADQVLNYDVVANLRPAIDGSDGLPATVPARPPVISTVPHPRNGLLSKQSDFAAGAATPSKEVVNNWSALPVDRNKAVYYAFENRFSPGPLGLKPCGGIAFFYPALESYWVRLLDKEEKLYDRQNPNLVTVNKTTYTYETNPVHFQVKSTGYSTSTTGKTLYTEYTYPADYTGISSGVLSRMKSDDHYLHNAAVETVQSVSDASGTRVTGATFTTYGEAGNAPDGQARILPFHVEALEIDAPKASFASSIASGAAADGDYRSKQTIAYYPNGNISQVTRTDDITTTYLWGYNHTYPIAEIRNATYAEVETALGQGVIEQLAAGASLSDTQEAQLNGLRENGSLKKAMVTTFTYNPLVGMTSQTDPNGITTHYQYDGLGRLKVVKDRDQHPVSRYEYHYKQ